MGILISGKHLYYIFVRPFLESEWKGLRIDYYITPLKFILNYENSLHSVNSDSKKKTSNLQE